MTHDELLAKIGEYFAYGRINDTLAKALRAVVELHKPPYDGSFCHRCEENYPCATIQAIEEELQ